MSADEINFVTTYEEGKFMDFWKLQLFLGYYKNLFITLVMIILKNQKIFFQIMKKTARLA